MGSGRLVVAAVLALSVGTSAASAATLTVTTTTDERTAGDGQCSLREAIDAVNSPGTPGDCSLASSGANTIVLGVHSYALTRYAGLYPPPPPTGCLFGDMTSTDNAFGNLAVNASVHNLTIKGAGASKTTIDACRLRDRALSIAAGASVTLQDLTIANGHAPYGRPGTNGVTFGQAGGTGSPGGNGGAIDNGGTLTLTRTVLSSNQAGGGGTGGTGAHSGNATAGGNGGSGGSGGTGGAIYSDVGSVLTITDSTLSANASGGGGAGGPGNTSLLGSGGAGGGGGAGGNGGAILSHAELTITGSTIDDNHAGSGGDGVAGIALGVGASGSGGSGGNGGLGGSVGGVATLGGSLSLTNSTVASNAAGDGGSSAKGGDGLNDINPGGEGGNGGNGGAGGGVGVAGTSPAQLLNVTVARNGVGAGQPGAAGGSPSPGSGANGVNGVGGGIFVPKLSNLTLTNTLVYANGNGGNCASTSSTPITSVITDGGHNLSYSPPMIGPLNVPRCPSTFLGGDPKVGNLQNNLGPTETMDLGSGSTAINQIPAGDTCPATDQRGLPRPSGAGCDIGAYEVTPPKLTRGSVTASASSAVLKATGVANYPHTTVQLRFGKTSALGSQSTTINIAGAGPTALTVHLSHLTAHSTYHYRWVATSADGTTQTADATFTTPARKPVISKLKLKHAKLTYRDSEAATTKFTLFRLKGKRLVKVRSFKHHDKTGPNSIKLKLGKGRYRLTATPTFARARGKTVRITFRVK